MSQMIGKTVVVTGASRGIGAALPIMLAAGSGTIVNVSSGPAVNAFEGLSHYCSSKAAVSALTRCADKEYSKHGIDVVGLAPGTVTTDMQRSIKDFGVEPISQMDWSDHIPVDWVAKAIAHLCTGGAKDYRCTDFSLKTNGARAAVGLPLTSPVDGTRPSKQEEALGEQY